MTFTAESPHTTMPPAAARFVDIPELLVCLGEVIANRKLLLDLCFTNKSFNTAFTPFLYAELWFNEGNAHILLDQLEALLANTALKHTKILDFYLAPGRLQREDKSDGELCQAFNEAIQAILGKTPNLTGFSWDAQPLFATTISALHSECPDLKSLSISHPVDIEKLRSTAFEYEDFDFEDGLFELRPLFETQDFSPFTNLTTLELHEIHGDLDQARRDIVKILLASPDLKTLSLSLNSDTVIRLDQEAQDIEEMGGYLDFLKTLIGEYVAAEGQTLHLRKLVLGLSIVLWEDDQQQPATYLDGLTNLSKLEEVYVCNNGVDTQLYFDDPDGIAWSTFTPETCPNLNILGLHKFTNDVERWIQNIGPGYLSQLRVEETLGHDISEICAALESNDEEASSKVRMLTLVDADATLRGADGLVSLKIPSLQALSVTLPQLTSDSRPAVLTWISSWQSLQQLYLQNVKVIVGEDTEYENLVKDIAAVTPHLRYLKLDGHSWRIWRDGDNGDKSQYSPEKLDKFEERSVEAFKSQRSFHVSE
ncbi:hypothetical protein BKA64DRAFT_656098 [Cadophora sp. MPI-SDFR-AT-0126]|nr:hypothetical protein BKA64DRAFT_656098 [Leotiomycetes sp. MPI-SDFR-AT-0126]